MEQIIETEKCPFCDNNTPIIQGPKGDLLMCVKCNQCYIRQDGDGWKFVDATTEAMHRLKRIVELLKSEK